MNSPNSSNYQTINFFSKLKDKKSINILNDLFKFINSTFPEICDKTNDLSEISISVQDFISKSVNEFAKIWNIEFTNSQFAYSEICDGFENLITKSLYNGIMNIIGEDNKLEKLCRKYSFINIKHLGIDSPIDDFELATQVKSKILFIIINVKIFVS